MIKKKYQNQIYSKLILKFIVFEYKQLNKNRSNIDSINLITYNEWK